MTYDLIMIVASKDGDLILMTQAAIDSALADGAQVNVILVETFKEHPYKNVDNLLIYQGEFNYNRALNLGLSVAKGDIAILANNDIYFESGWSSIGHTMRQNGYMSASALSDDKRMRVFKRGDYAYEGYVIGMHLAGWCIFMDREHVLNKIGPLDERFTFWYSDNAYAEQLQKAGLKHAMICNAKVLHYTSSTLSKERADRRNLLTYAQGKKLLRTNSKNLQKKL